MTVISFMQPRLTSYGAALMLTASATSAQSICNAHLVPDPFPAPFILDTPVGSSGSVYEVESLPSPVAVPLGVVASDADQLIAICASTCEFEARGSDITIDWDLVGGTDQGAFLDEHGQMRRSVDGYDHILYLPPSDLEVNEERTIEIQARTVDLCQDAQDPTTVLYFEAWVKRQPDDPTHALVRRYDVRVRYVNAEVEPQSPINCAPITGDPSTCEIVGFEIQQDPAPYGTVVRAPDAMVVGETRPLVCNATDLDTAVMECGNNISSDFASRLVCDRFVSIDWSVDVLTGYDGDGVFERQGRTALFRATQPGLVSVSFVAVASDGEIVFGSHVISIEAPRVRGVEFENAFEVAMDSAADYYSSTPPTGPDIYYQGLDWYDHDGDGAAATPDPDRHNGEDLSGDRSFPVAWDLTVVGQTPPALSRLQVTAHTPMMPGALVRAYRGDLLEYEFIDGATVSVADPFVTEALGLQGRSVLDLPVGLHEDTPIRVEVSFDAVHWIEAGEALNDWYVLLQTPLLNGQESSIGGARPFHYFPYETLLAIACRSQSGDPTTAAEVFAGVWADFTSTGPSPQLSEIGLQVPLTRRVDRDGFLNVQDEVMEVEFDVSGSFYSYGWNRDSFRELLRDDSLSSGFSASTSGWATLMRATLMAHGIESTVMEIVPPDLVEDSLPSANPLGYGTAIGSYRTEFMVAHNILELAYLDAGVLGPLDGFAYAFDTSPIPGAYADRESIGTTTLKQFVLGLPVQARGRAPKAHRRHFVVRGPDGRIYDPTYASGNFELLGPITQGVTGDPIWFSETYEASVMFGYGKMSRRVGSIVGGQPRVSVAAQSPFGPDLAFYERLY